MQLGIAGNHAVSRLVREQHQLCATFSVEVFRAAAALVANLACVFYESLNRAQSIADIHNSKIASETDCDRQLRAFGNEECEAMKHEITLCARGMGWNTPAAAAGGGNGLGPAPSYTRSAYPQAATQAASIDAIVAKFRATVAEVLYRQQNDLSGALRNDAAMAGSFTAMSFSAGAPRVVFPHDEMFVLARAFEKNIRALVLSWQKTALSSLLASDLPEPTTVSVPTAGSAPKSAQGKEIHEAVEMSGVAKHAHMHVEELRLAPAVSDENAAPAN
jgi:hypothetical protein